MASNIVNQNLICPNCKGRLEPKKNSLYCVNCNISAKSDNGVVDFLNEKGYYWGEIPPDKMRIVNKTSIKQGWRKVVRDLIVEYPKMEEYLLNHGRVDWLFHALDLKRADNCLDIGSGWGSLAFDLAKYYKNVYSLESVKERVEFQSIRKEEDKVQNLTVIRADFMKLPFKDNTFDLVVVNGVLEWVGISDYQDSPKSMQLNFLQEIRRILKPGGCVYVGIENRFGLQYILGAEDHSGLPYTSLIPRWLADIVVRHLRKTEGKYKLKIRMEKDWQNYRTYTYSLWGYKSLFADAGFNKVKTYWTLFYSNPKFSGLINGNNFKFFASFIVNNSKGNVGNLGAKLAMVIKYFPSNLVKYLVQVFSPSFLFYLYKEEIKQNFEDKVVGNDSNYLKMAGSSGEVGKINYFILKDNIPTKVVKFARFNSREKDFEKEVSLAKKFSGIKVSSKKIDNKLVFEEDFKKGQHLDDTNFEQVDLVVDWLLNFQKTNSNNQYKKDQLDLEIKRLKMFIDVLPLDKKTKLNGKEKLDEYKKNILKYSIKKTLQHGDFCSSNIIISEENRIHLVDWENSEENKGPFFDLIFFLLHNSNKNGEDILSSWVSDTAYSKQFNKIVNKIVTFYNIDQNVVKSSIPYVVLLLLERYADSTGMHIDTWNKNITLFKKLINEEI